MKKAISEKMKRAVAFCLALVTLLLVPTALVSCGKKSKPHPVGLEENGAVLRDLTSGITYRAAGFDLVADKLEGVYANVSVGDSGIDLFRVAGYDPAEWLGDADRDLFYADGVTCPTLADFSGEGTALSVVNVDGKTVATENDAALVSLIAEAFIDAPSKGYAFSRPTATAVARYDVYISSPDVKGMKYHLLCYVYDGIKAFGVDRDGQTVRGQVVLYSREYEWGTVLPEGLKDLIPVPVPEQKDA